MKPTESYAPPCDVLVIGSGAAGLRAVIAARERGAEVLLLSKSPLGSASCTMYSGGLFTFAVPGGLSVEEHYRNTLEAGRGLNDERLAFVLCQEGPEAVWELEERFNVRFQPLPSGGTTAPFAAPVRGGTGIVQGMAAYAKRIGVQAQEGVMAAALLQDGHGAVAGVLGLMVGVGELVWYPAKAVVLATGGAGAIYLRTDNPRQITGDGYALAYRAGVPLMDMEFVQFYPTSLAEPGTPITTIPFSWTDLFPVTNARGQEFLRVLLDEHGLTAREAGLRLRDLAARAIALEVQEGQGQAGAVRMDFSRVSPEQMERDPRLAFFVKKQISRLPFRERPLHVAPAVHHFMGGVTINEHGQTDLPGLFAAGEVCAGVHGANRHGGNALTDTIVFGRRAGEAAADWAQREGRAVPQPAEVAAARDKLCQWLGQRSQGDLTAKELREAVRVVAGEHLYVIRSAEGLKRILARLAELVEQKVYVATTRELVDVVEARNLLLVAKLVAQAALERQESRGAHFRLDYPQQDDLHWRRHIVLEKN